MLGPQSPPSIEGEKRGLMSRASRTTLKETHDTSHSSLFSSGGWRFYYCKQARCTARPSTNKHRFHGDPHKAQKEYVSQSQLTGSRSPYTRWPPPCCITDFPPGESLYSQSNTQYVHKSQCKGIRSPYVRRPVPISVSSRWVTGDG